MIKRRIIATKLSITKQGEIKFFQVKIPFDAISIMGIETTMRLRNFVAQPVPNIAVPNDVPFGNVVAFNGDGGDMGNIQPLAFFGVPAPIDIPRNVLAGELKLQSSDDCNVFYATDVFDQSVKENLDKAPSVTFITENVWTHGYKRELENVLVDGNTTVIAGLYKDRLGEMIGQNITYDVFLYVWYKFKKENKK